MRPICRTLAVAFTALITASLLFAQVKESAVTKEIDNLRNLPDTQRPAATVKVAQEVATMPQGLPKIKLADGLAHLVTEGDQGAETIQAVADVLSKSLAESPVPAKGNEPPEVYIDLARLVRYEGVTSTLTDPQYVKAGQVLADIDADVQKQDFTLKDMHNKPVTLSALKGKIVMVNFWATWCPPCRVEMPVLNALSTSFESQGLVVLSVTDEDGMKVGQFFANYKYHPSVLLDPGGKVHKQFHIRGIPETFIFGRDGKLIGQTIDQGTVKQFLALLSKTDLHN